MFFICVHSDSRHGGTFGEVWWKNGPGGCGEQLYLRTHIPSCCPQHFFPSSPGFKGYLTTGNILHMLHRRDFTIVLWRHGVDLCVAVPRRVTTRLVAPISHP